MPWIELTWEWDEEDGNVAHMAEHGVSPEDVEEVFENPIRYERSRSSGRPMVFGYTSDGRRIAVGAQSPRARERQNRCDGGPVVGPVFARRGQGGDEQRPRHQPQREDCIERASLVVRHRSTV